MSATGRPERELLPLGGKARSAKGALVSAKGRPERELLPLGGKARSAKGALVSAKGRPERELRGLRERFVIGTNRHVGRRPRSQARPSGLGFALLTRASPGGKARGAKGVQ